MAKELEINGQKNRSVSLKKFIDFVESNFISDSNITSSNPQKTLIQRYINYIKSIFVNTKPKEIVKYCVINGERYGFESTKETYVILNNAVLNLTSSSKDLMGCGSLDEKQKIYKTIPFDEIFCDIIRDKEMTSSEKCQLLMINLILKKSGTLHSGFLYGDTGNKLSSDRYIYEQHYSTLSRLLNDELKNLKDKKESHSLTDEECKETVKLFRQEFPFYESKSENIDKILKDFPPEKSFLNLRYIKNFLKNNFDSIFSALRSKVDNLVNKVKDIISKSKENVTNLNKSDIVTPPLGNKRTSENNLSEIDY